jgi:hypothetical protein
MANFVCVGAMGRWSGDGGDRYSVTVDYPNSFMAQFLIKIEKPLKTEVISCDFVFFDAQHSFI